MYQDRTLSHLLAYIGALPFWALALAGIAGVAPTWATFAFVAYGTGIACFMAGAIWSQSQIHQTRARLFLILSNAAALVAIGALLLHEAAPAVALGLQAGTFLALLACDHAMLRSGHQPAWYFHLRRNVTALVVASYAALLLGNLFLSRL